jgi:hypothetical protein
MKHKNPVAKNAYKFNKNKIIGDAKTIRSKIKYDIIDYTLEIDKALSLFEDYEFMMKVLGEDE